MVKVSQVNSAHCKNWTCILKRKEYLLILFICFTRKFTGVGFWIQQGHANSNLKKFKIIIYAFQMIWKCDNKKYWDEEDGGTQCNFI